MSQITTHILDTARGTPAAAVPLRLFARADDGWRQLASAVTDRDGRAPGLIPPGEVLNAGVYRMHFVTQAYFDACSSPVFYPWVDVVFQLDGSDAHYHIPLLLSPYGYSTYRGS